MDYKQTNWYRYMEEPMRDLVQQSFTLLEMFSVYDSRFEYHDYSFVVFPIAKAYEGFLKKLFLDMGLIYKRQYLGEHFRVGSALNPNLPKRYRTGWVFGRLVTSCGGEELPMALWEVWKKARNRIFHFFPDHHEFISLDEAKQLIDELDRVMSRAVEGC